MLLASFGLSLMLLRILTTLLISFYLNLPQNFHEVAYFADDRQDLLNGINEFLDCSIVIPPSDVEGKDLLKTVASFQKQMLRKRREREHKKCGSTVTGNEQETKGLKWRSTNPYLLHFHVLLMLTCSFGHPCRCEYG